MGRNRLKSQTVRIAEGSSSPRGYVIEFYPGFPNPPESGSLLLLSNSGRHAVVETYSRTVGSGTGAATSAVVMQALGCQADSEIWFRQALFRDWLHHGHEAKRRLRVLFAEVVVVVLGVVLLILSELDSSRALLIVMAFVAAVLLVAHLVREHANFKQVVSSA